MLAQLWTISPFLASSYAPYFLWSISHAFLLIVFVSGMKTAIRLQNHGCANHPYWWIVVAANRKNLKGRFLQHVGYWSPRQGVAMQRQIVINIPRVKHWISCGAVPTFKVQKFLALWNILPQPWYQQRTPQELAAMKKPESEWTDKDRIKQQRKRKRREREKLQPVNYYRRESMFKGAQYSQLHKYSNKLREKIHAAERENQILRELLLHNEFQKLNRIGELSGKVVYDDSEELARLEEELARAKSQLALLNKNFKDTTLLHKIKAMQDINKLVDKIRDVQKKRDPFRKRTSAAVHDNQEVSQYELNRKLEYEMVTKKIEKMNEEFAQLDSLHEVVTLEEYANHLLTLHPEAGPEDALQAAQEIFMERGRTARAPLTKFDLYFEEELSRDAENLPDDPLPPTKQMNRKRKIVDGKVVVNEEKQAKEAAKKQAYKAKLEEYDARREAEERQGKTELQLRNMDELKHHNQVLKKIDEPQILPYLLARPDVIVPTNRPVHPFPDLDAYIPEEYYEPITTFDIQLTPISSLEPKEELDKYHQKREYSAPHTAKLPAKKEKKGKRSDAVL